MVTLFGRDWEYSELAMMGGGVAVLVWVLGRHLVGQDAADDRRQAGLLGTAFRVVRRDPATLVFTAAAALVTLVPLSAIALHVQSREGIARLGALALFSYGEVHAESLAPATLAAGWAEMLILTLFCFGAGGLASCAVLRCAITRLRGEEPTLADAVRATGRLAPSLLTWAAAEAGRVTGLLFLARRYPRLQRSALLDTRWEHAGKFTLPVMVAEGLDAPKAIARERELQRSIAIDERSMELADEATAMMAIVPFMLVFVGGLAFGIYAGDDFFGRHLIAIFALPVLTALVVGAFAATLYLIVLAAAYLRAVETGDRLVSVLRAFPPGVFEE